MTSLTISYYIVNIKQNQCIYDVKINIYLDGAYKKEHAEMKIRVHLKTAGKKGRNYQLLFNTKLKVGIFIHNTILGW